MNKNRSKSPVFKHGTNNNIKRNFDGFKNNDRKTSASKDWMVDFTFNDSKQNNEKTNYAGFEDDGFDFDFVTTNTNAANKPSNSNMPITPKGIKDEFEDFIFTTSNVPTDATKSYSVNNNKNLIDFGNNNANNNFHNQNRVNQINNNIGLNYNNQSNQNPNANSDYNNNNNNKMYGYNVNTGYIEQQYSHKPSSMNQINSNVNTFGYGIQSINGNKVGNNIQSNPNYNAQIQSNTSTNKRSDQQNIYDFFK